MDFEKDKNGRDQLAGLDLSALEEIELRSLLEEAETDSENYFAILEELGRRNPDIEAISTEDDSNDEISDEGNPESDDEDNPESDDEDTPAEVAQTLSEKKYKPLSTLGSRLWVILTALISLAGGGYFLYEQKRFTEVTDSQILIMLAIVLLLTSLSYLLAGIRFLINRANGITKRNMIHIELWIMTGLWAIIGVFMLYYTVSSVVPFYRVGFDMKYIVLLSLPLLIPVFLSLLLSVSFSYLAQELSKKR